MIIKFCQMGGSKIVSSAKSHPFASKKCDHSECNVCSIPKSNGGCRFGNVGYQLVCLLCCDSDLVATYQGETSKSSYEHDQQHQSNLTKKIADTPMWKHSEIHHNADNTIKFAMEVPGRFQKSMIRQEDEAVQIRETQAGVQMNSKCAYHQPSLIRLLAASGNQHLNQQGQKAPTMECQSKRKANNQPRLDSPVIPMRTRSYGKTSSSNGHSLVQNSNNGHRAQVPKCLSTELCLQEEQSPHSPHLIKQFQQTPTPIKFLLNSQSVVLVVIVTVL